VITVLVWFTFALLVLSSVTTVLIIGMERKPVTPMVALIGVALNMVVGITVWNLAVTAGVL
jgi:hypothetical protein